MAVNDTPKTPQTPQTPQTPSTSTPGSSLSRRAFVGGGLASAALITAALAGCSTDDGEPGAGAGPGATDPNQIAWDKEVDVLVVGSGAAGLVSATIMARSGLTVTVIDRNAETGGCSVLAGGSCGFSSPLGTPGNPWPNYTNEDAIAYLTNKDSVPNKKNNKELVKAFVENTANAMELIVDVGCDFEYTAGSRPGIAFYDHPDEPGPGLTYKFLGADKDDTCGSGLIRPFEYAVKDAGGEILQSHMLKKLYRDVETGRVIGGMVDANGTTINIKAAKGVMLGSSGWKGSEWLRQCFDPRIPTDMKHTGAPFAINDGTGIIAALEVGACFASDQSNDSALWRVKFGTPWYNYRLGSSIAPPGIFPAAAQANRFIFVNKAGQRFVDESKEISAAPYADIALDQEDCLAWMIFDEEGAKQHDWDITPPITDPEYAFKTETLDELAAKIGVAPATLKATVDGYNACVDAGIDSDFAKPADKLVNKIETGPFYGVRALLFVHDTAGGLAINAKAEVLDLYGEAIGGLYAAGDAAGGISVIGLPRAIVFGYIAGKQLAG